MANRRQRRPGEDPPTLDPRGFTIAEYREYVEAVHEIGPGCLSRCSPRQLEHVMRAQGLSRLPGLYREFLLTLGGNPSPLLPSFDCRYPDLVQIKGYLIDDLSGDGLDTSFLDGTLVIGLADGHFLLYIPGAETAGGDPPVWTSSDGFDRKRAYSSFREFLLAIADPRPGAVRIS
ncbi:hypothetical protein ACFQ07_32195 [Actinomadura adrarensis]|uniref:SMI1/KNR4 family protein n=1 Tax=Actinomadura adrarensis TaxID=1819600 RepID=A0ABW3CTX7_9ACTN